jgi:hypothetical protein
MMSNAPTHALTAESAVPAEDVRSAKVVDRFLGWLQQSLCALHGHDAILQYERTRIFLRCTSCGHETPGWEVASRALTARHRPAESRPTLAPRGGLAVARKIA